MLEFARQLIVAGRTGHGHPSGIAVLFEQSEEFRQFDRAASQRDFATSGGAAKANGVAGIKVERVFRQPLHRLGWVLPRQDQRGRVEGDSQGTNRKRFDELLQVLGRIGASRGAKRGTNTLPELSEVGQGLRERLPGDARGFGWNLADMIDDDAGAHVPSELHRLAGAFDAGFEVVEDVVTPLSVEGDRAGPQIQIIQHLPHMPHPGTRKFVEADFSTGIDFDGLGSHARRGEQCLLERLAKAGELDADANL